MIEQTIINENWILAYTSLSKGNVMDWEIEEDGVLRVDVWCLGRDDYRPDFMIDSLREVYSDQEGGHQWANIKFVLPMPEDITSDGDADFKALCDKTAGEHDPVIYWSERIEAERSWAYRHGRYMKRLIALEQAGKLC